MKLISNQIITEDSEVNTFLPSHIAEDYMQLKADVRNAITEINKIETNPTPEQKQMLFKIADISSATISSAPLTITPAVNQRVVITSMYAASISNFSLSSGGFDIFPFGSKTLMTDATSPTSLNQIRIGCNNSTPGGSAEIKFSVGDPVTITRDQSNIFVNWIIEEAYEYAP